MNTDKEKGVFLNGRQQIIDMLRFMNESEKQKLIHNISSKNAVMARELSEQSLSFSSLEKLSQEELSTLCSHFNPAILGLALYPMPTNFQRKILVSIPRQLAEKAFGIMQQDLSAKTTQCSRAQEKILSTAISLNRQMKINL